MPEEILIQDLIAKALSHTLSQEEIEAFKKQNIEKSKPFLLKQTPGEYFSEL